MLSKTIMHMNDAELCVASRDINKAYGSYEDLVKDNDVEYEAIECINEKRLEPYSMPKEETIKIMELIDELRSK